MTEKEFHKLRRHDLLQLLVTQMREGHTLQQELDGKNEELLRFQTSDEHLKSKLDDKDVQIERLKERLNEKDDQLAKLKGKLDEKDAQLERLKKRLDEKDARILGLKEEMEERFSRRKTELEGFGAVADEMARLESIFGDAQKATERCLFNIHQLFEEHLGSQEQPGGAAGEE